MRQAITHKKAPINRRLGRVLNLNESNQMDWKRLDFAKLSQIADSYLDIICAIFPFWRQFISSLSSFLKWGHALVGMTVDNGYEPIYKDFSQNTHKTADLPPNRLNVSLSCA